MGKPEAQIEIQWPKLHIWFIIGGLLICLGLGQDLLHSRTNNYAFYIEESLLFNVIWVFLPIYLYVLFTIQGKFKIHWTLTSGLALVLGLTLCHLISFSLAVHLISLLFFESAFKFFKTFAYATTEYSLICIICYSVGLGVMRRLFESRPRIDAAEPSMKREKIFVQQGSSKMGIQIDGILYIKSDAPYVAITTANSRLLHKGTLKAMEQQLATHRFIRIHKSAVVNLNHVTAMHSRKNGDYDLKMDNGQVLRLSRRFAKIFKERYH